MPNLPRLTGLAALIALGLGAAPLSAQTGTEEDQEAEAAPVAEESEAEGSEASAPEVLEDYDADTVVMTVQGVDVTLGELIAARQTLPDQYQQLPGEVLMQALSEQYATQILLAEAARKAGVGERADVRLRLKTQEMAVLAETYLRQEIQSRVTEADIQAAYDATYANAEPQEEVRAAHILVETEEEAKAIKAELDGGADFAALAGEHGTDGTSERGGDLGWFIQTDMVPEFGDAAFAMEKGAISAPVQSPFGWHLIKLEDRRPRAAPPLEQVSGEIQGQLIQDAERAVISEINAARDVSMPEIGVPGDAIKEDNLLTPAE
ncbi:MAG: peptidylprolyl isomerase [Pseudomonadota bacterium]